MRRFSRFFSGRWINLKGNHDRECLMLLQLSIKCQNVLYNVRSRGEHVGKTKYSQNIRIFIYALRFPIISISYPNTFFQIDFNFFVHFRFVHSTIETNKLSNVLWLKQGGNRSKKKRNSTGARIQTRATETHYCANQADTFVIFPSIAAR